MAEKLPDFSGIWPEWRAVEKVGEGSFGKVYKCERNEYGINAVCAIKIISIPKNESEINAVRAENSSEYAVKMHFQGIVEDFANEIKMMVVLKGAPNIVSVENYKIVERTDEIGWDIYIRMEYLTAFTKFARENSFTERAVTRLASDLCTALEICAEKNIIHRDIKPDNIFIDSYGNYKIGDFGVARRLENATSAMSKKGTYTYMAPEVYRGDKYDNRADVYSLGMVMYKLLNRGKDPFTNPYSEAVSYHERQNALERRMHGENLPAPVDASPEMARIILRACAYSPLQRYSSPSEMKRDLKNLADGSVAVAASALGNENSAGGSKAPLPLFMEDNLIDSLSERSRQPDADLMAKEPEAEEATQMYADEATAFAEYDDPTAFAQNEQPAAFSGDEPTGFAYDEATAFAESDEDTVIANNRPPKVTKADYGIVEADEYDEESEEDDYDFADLQPSDDDNKGINIIGIVIAVLVIAAIGVTCYYLFWRTPNSSVQFPDTPIDPSIYYDDGSGNYDGNGYIVEDEQYDIQADIDAINSIKTDFENNDISYSYACDQLSVYLNSSYYEVSSAASTAQSEIDAVNTNREYYNDGVEYLANDSYTAAIDAFNKVSSDYPQYSDVEAKLSEAKQAYKEWTMSWVDYHINSNEFDSARSKLDSLSSYVDDSDVANAYDRIDAAEDEYYLETYWQDQTIYIVEDSEEIFYLSGEKSLRMNIHNSSGKTVETTYISVLEFDSNGNPITRTEYIGSYYNEYRIYNSDQIDSYSTLDMTEEDTSWDSVNSDTYYAIACVRYVKYTDGSEWHNNYYDYWLEAYHDSYWDYANRDY